MKARRGQIAIYLVVVLVVFLLLTLLNVDTFTAVRTKNRLQNAGDAAALAAARRQGGLINEIGRLNIQHIIQAVKGNAKECKEIVLTQRRTALLGPVDALRLANEAALRNGLEVRPEFSKILENHIADIRLVYAGGGGDGDPYPEPFPGAWTEYATAIDNAISDGLATGPDNIEFYCAKCGHLLLNRQFYQAISGKDWCWFFFECMETLEGYDSYHDWNPLPDRRSNTTDNSEIYSLHVKAVKVALTDVFTHEEIMELVKRFSDEPISKEELDKSELIADNEQIWFFFDEWTWTEWFRGRALVGDNGAYDFPIVGEVKPEYNIRGCAAVNRCAAETASVAVDSTSHFTWSAAAKPFGCLENFEGEMSPVTAIRRLVVPCMRDVRLVPIDSVCDQNLATADAAWVNHIREHLPVYLAKGPNLLHDCWYCQQLKTWEHASFRREGIRWLKYNSGTCVRHGSGGPVGSGGTVRGH